MLNFSTLGKARTLTLSSIIFSGTQWQTVINSGSFSHTYNFSVDLENGCSFLISKLLMSYAIKLYQTLHKNLKRMNLLHAKH